MNTATRCETGGGVKRTTLFQLVPYAGTTRIRFNGIRMRDLSPLHGPVFRQTAAGTPTRFRRQSKERVPDAQPRFSVTDLAQHLQQREHDQPGDGAARQQAIEFV
ncbi:MAG: hypothetical protein JWM78_1558 [Verrucomicrobiaceae bacterium]|nr:hypothetical protein [Verrucomicrobiaceae bacterium]